MQTYCFKRNPEHSCIIHACVNNLHIGLYIVYNYNYGWTIKLFKFFVSLDEGISIFFCCA